MAQHLHINIDPDTLAMRVAQTALRTAQSAQTRKAANIYIPDGEGTGVLIGDTADAGISRYDPATETQSPLWEGISQEELDAKAEEILAAADESVKSQIEQVNKDLQDTSDRIDTKADEILEAAKADATAKVDAVDQKVQATNSKVEANADAIKAESDRVNSLGTKVGEQGTKLSEVEDSLEEAKQAALGAQVTADGKNAIYRATTDPAADAAVAAKLTAGDLWWQTSAANLETYWLGEPNNSVSVLVDHSDEIEAMWIWNGSRWNRHVLYAQDLLVNGSIVAELLAVDCVEARHIKVGAIEADKLSATALYGHVIKGGTFLTSNERLVINNEGLLLKDVGGNATITMLSEDGSATFRDVLIDGGSLTTPTITTGDIDASTIHGSTVTGGTVQTVVDANRGIKLTGGNLDIYREDQQRFLRANEAGVVISDGVKNVLAFALVDGVWTLSLDGAIQSGGEISGAAITGAVIRTNTEWQSSEAAKKYRGLVITDGGMYAYKNNGKEEYSMAFTASTGELKLDGAIASNAVFNAPTISAGQMIGTNIYTGTDTDNRVSITSAGLTVTHGGQTVISFAADGAVDLGTSGIAADSRVSDLTDEVHDSYTPLATFTQTTDALGESVTNVQTQVGATADRLDEEINTRKQYMQFDPNNGLTIGDLTNTDAYSVQLTTTAMQFRAGNTVAAYVSNDRLYINNAEIVNTLRIGNFAFLPRDNGHMSLQYVGGSATVQEA